jgi:hypothetical protein
MREQGNKTPPSTHALYYVEEIVMPPTTPPPKKKYLVLQLLFSCHHYSKRNRLYQNVFGLLYCTDSNFRFYVRLNRCFNITILTDSYVNAFMLYLWLVAP